MKIHEYQGKELLKQFGVPCRAVFPLFPSTRPWLPLKSWVDRFGSSRRRSTLAAAARAAA